MTPSLQETQSSGLRSRSERAFLVIATVTGAALLAQGPSAARPFGLLFVAAAAYVLFSARIDRHWTSLTDRATNLLARVPISGRFIVDTVGFALLAFGVFARDAMPAPLPRFYSVLGLVLIAAAFAHKRMQRSSDNKGGHISVLLAALAAALPALALVGVTVRYGVNFPFFDEYASTLPLALDFSAMSGPERLDAILASHNGHRIATTRLATLAGVAVTGHVNFYALMLLSNAILVASVAVIVWSFRGHRTLALAAPFSLVLLQPQYHQLTLWAFSIQHFAVLLFAAASFALLSRPSAYAFAGAVVCGLLAAFSFGGGIVVAAIGLGYLVQQRHYTRATMWLLLWGVVIVLYFRGLSLDSGTGLQPGVLERAAYLLEFLGSAATLGVFTDFIGGKQADAALYPAAVWAARVAGALMLCAFAWLTALRYWTRNLTVYGLLALTAISAVLAAALRGNIPYSEPFMSRYAINSVLFAGLLLIALLDLHSHVLRPWIPAISIVTALFCMTSFIVTAPYARAHSADLRYLALLTETARHTDTVPWKVQFPFFNFELLDRAVESGTYHLPDDRVYGNFISGHVEPPADAIATANSVNGMSVVYIGEISFAYVVFISAPAHDTNIAAVLSGGGTEIRAFEANTPGSLNIHRKFFENNGPSGATHIALIPKSDLPRPISEYYVGLAVLPAEG